VVPQKLGGLRNEKSRRPAHPSEKQAAQNANALPRPVLVTQPNSRTPRHTNGRGAGTSRLTAVRQARFFV